MSMPQKLQCIHCQNSLDGITADGVCPSCGKPVRDTFAPAAKPPMIALIKQLGPTAILGALWTICPAVLGTMLLIYLGDVSEWLRSLGGWGIAAYIGIFVISAGIGFLPTYGQSMLGGWTFGFTAGFAGAMCGFVGGSLIGFGIAKTVSKQRIEQALKEHPKGMVVRDALLRHGFWRSLLIITLIRIPPNSPFALTNLVLASSGAKLSTYILGTALGMAPRTAIAVWLAAAGAGTGASNLKELVENQPWWAIPAAMGIAFVVLAIIGSIAKRALDAVTQDAKQSGPPQGQTTPPMPTKPEDAAV
jgi:uncharacterized membrane protein YdjX (TVP38/TMEM64 family)